MHEVSRELTQEELRLLELIRAHHGPQNTVEDVSWDGDQAVFWVKARDGSRGLATNLTNLASWHADGTISRGELHDWLQISDA